MSKRSYSARPTSSSIPSDLHNLPTNRPIAVYYRQSTIAQIGNNSTAIQIIDMAQHLRQRGWSDKDIIMIDMDAGISGMKKIDERPGMRLLFDLITENKIGAVACQDEDRLFRDVTQIQVNIFIEACRASRVLVITPNMVYDFANEQMGTFHARQFRFKSEMAAEYINSVIHGKLANSKLRVLMEGRCAGGTIPVGFMVDMRKTLPDGTPNPSWRRLVPFPPYAEIIVEYFQLFVSFAGNANATVRHIRRHGPYYPEPGSCLPPDGFKIHYRMRAYKNGYYPGRTGIVDLLTNAAYIGHWHVRGAIVRKNNHQGIVPEDIFMTAFNYLSNVTLDGHPNPDYRPFKEHARPSIDDKRSVERPLCMGMIVSPDEDRFGNVGTNWNGKNRCYMYVFQTRDAVERVRWLKVATYVDETITDLLREKLRLTFDASIWEQALASFEEEFTKERRRKVAQLSSLERVMESLIAGLDILSNPEMIKAVQSRYEEAQAERTRLVSDLQTIENEAEHLSSVHLLKKTCGPALGNWEHLSRENKRVILHAFIDRIEAYPIRQHVVRFVIRWRDGGMDEVTLTKSNTVGTTWFPNEIERLLSLVDAGASQIEIAQSFPTRKWELIRFKFYRLRGYYLHFSPKLIRDFETYESFIVRTGGALSTCVDLGHWLPEEDKVLLNLLDSGASQIEIAEACPNRTWGGIRARIRKLRGNNVPVPGVGVIKTKETIGHYKARTGQSIDKACSSEESTTSSEASRSCLTISLRRSSRATCC